MIEVFIFGRLGILIKQVTRLCHGISVFESFVSNSTKCLGCISVDTNFMCQKVFTAHDYTWHFGCLTAVTAM